MYVFFPAGGVLYNYLLRALPLAGGLPLLGFSEPLVPCSGRFSVALAGTSAAYCAQAAAEHECIWGPSFESMNNKSLEG